MISFLKFLIWRLVAVPITLFVITAVLYGIIMLAPPEERAMLYFPPRTRATTPPELLQAKINQIIVEHGLDDPYPQQYLRWVGGLLRGDWGWSPTFNEDVLTILLRRTPVTAELTLYSVLLLIPLGLFSGVVAGWRNNGRLDSSFRFVAFMATAIPPFILALFLLSIFYVGLRWFPPGRTGIVELSLRTASTTFTAYTGLLTVDGLLNGRTDVTIDALRHLVLPVFALSLTHWATLGRVTRVSIIEQKHEDYIIFARARGLRPRTVVWVHAFRNALLPALTSSALSAASLVTGVFIIETIFNMKGLSELVTRGMTTTPDTPLALGFAVYSVLLVLPLLIVLDILKAVVDPRLRQEAGIS